MFLGATTAIIAPDEKTLAYVAGRSRMALDPVYSDVDAVYDSVHTVDVTELEPIVVAPPSPANTRDLAEYAGLEVHSGYLGSCASGRLEDLRAAAPGSERPARSRRVSSSMSFRHRRRSWSAAASEGLISILVDAGAFISSLQLRLLLRTHRDDDGGPAGGLDRHAQRARAHGQRRLRNLSCATRQWSPLRRSRAASRIRGPTCEGSERMSLAEPCTGASPGSSPKTISTSI